mmetsp:Transcript_16061/g.43764  ORF Transcript_16061/g.43764 Transcript_16061/m.43764 type:complete len:210 (+) Transcript_16061:144-773(+)
MQQVLQLLPQMLLVLLLHCGTRGLCCRFWCCRWLLCCRGCLKQGVFARAAACLLPHFPLLLQALLQVQVLLHMSLQLLQLLPQVLVLLLFNYSIRSLCCCCRRCRCRRCCCRCFLQRDMVLFHHSIRNRCRRFLQSNLLLFHHSIKSLCCCCCCFLQSRHLLATKLPLWRRVQDLLLLQLLLPLLGLLMHYRIGGFLCHDPCCCCCCSF